MSNAVTALTIVHVAISLIAIALGTPAILHILQRRNSTKTVIAFFVFTALTTLTGFAFPITRFTPAIAFGLLTIVLLIVAWVANGKAPASGRWQLAYLLATLGTLYLNAVVLIVQSFTKIGPLHALAPTQSEWPFLATQLLLLVPFVLAIWRAMGNRLERQAV